MKMIKTWVILTLLLTNFETIFGQAVFGRKIKSPIVYQSNPQMSQWHFANTSGNNQIQFNSSVRAKNNLAGRPASALTNVSGFNSYADENGNLLFYVVSTKDGLRIYNKNNDSIQLPNSLSSQYCGKEITRYTHLLNQSKIDLSMLEKGLYLIQISNQLTQENTTFKIQKN